VEDEDEDPDLWADEPKEKQIMNYVWWIEELCSQCRVLVDNNHSVPYTLYSWLHKWYYK
jgi:hypothetical protein